MSSKLESAIWSRDTGTIGINGGLDGRMVIKNKFSRTAHGDGYNYRICIFLPMVLGYKYKYILIGHSQLGFSGPTKQNQRNYRTEQNNNNC